MRVLVACEYSAIVRDAFRSNGHDAWSCDIIPTEGDPKYHFQEDIIGLIQRDPYWDLMIAHPTCTYLTNAGVRHLFYDVTSKNGVRAKISGESRRKEMIKACAFFNILLNSPIPRICVENPIPHKYAVDYIGKYDQLIRPWHFGEKQNKAICLWLKNLPLLKYTNVVGPPPKEMNYAERHMWYQHHLAPDSKGRAKKRSKFFHSVAREMANQWGIIT